MSTMCANGLSDLQRVEEQVRFALVPVLAAHGWEWEQSPSAPPGSGHGVRVVLEPPSTGLLRDVLAGLRRGDAR